MNVNLNAVLEPRGYRTTPEDADKPFLELAPALEQARQLLEQDDANK